MTKSVILKTSIVAILTLVVFWFLFSTFTNTKDLISTIENINPWPVVLVFILTLITPLLNSLRFKSFLRLSGYNIVLSKIIVAIMSAWPLAVIPGRLGDLARSLPLKNDVPIKTSVGTIIFEKISDVLVLIILSAVGFLIIGKLSHSVLWLAILGIIIVALVNLKKIVRLLTTIVPNLEKIILIPSIIERLSKNKISFVEALSFSFLGWLVNIIKIGLLYKAVGITVPLEILLSYVPIAIFIGLLPLTIAGLGTRDGALIVMMISFATPAQSVLAGLGYAIFDYGLLGLIGIPFLIKESHHILKSTSS